MPQKSLLDRVEVASPCSESWNEMQGNETVRFCSHCAKNVHNLSAMTRKRARKIVVAANGNLCVRYMRRPDGKIETFKRQLVQLTGQTGVAASVFGASLTLSTLANAQTANFNLNEPTAVVVNAAKTMNQPNGSISGTITDQNGAVVPFALVTLSNQQTNFYQTLNTNQEGFYEFKDVPAGDYALKTNANGFAATELTQFSLSGETTQNLQLAVPEMQEVVQVGGNGNQVSYVTMGIIGAPISRSKLIAAVEDNDIEKVIDRLRKGDRINAKDKNYDGNTALHVAVENGNVQIARYLLSAGAKPNSKNAEKRTPLMLLDEDANVELVQVLLSYGAKINAFNRAGETALILAAESANTEVVQYLLSMGANLNAQNAQGRTALLNAAEANNTDVVKLLLGAGSNPNIQDNKGETALTLASNSDAIKQLLVSYGAQESSK